MMDPRIEYYMAQLKNVGHHHGQDPRRHEEEEEEEEEEEGQEEEEEQRQERERREHGRRERGRPAVVIERPAGAHLARRQQELVPFDDEEGDGMQDEDEDDIQEPQRVKRHAQRRRDVQGTHAKRARVSDASVKADRAESSPPREQDSENEESQSIEGSDLFGDRAYEDKIRFDIADSPE